MTGVTVGGGASAAAGEATREDVAEASAGWGYRPHLDGLRAVAVYLVVAYHAGVGRLAGGFIGVDVFFVLSGYLVTHLLVRDIRARGAVDLRRFYSRRARRLLPAALVTLVVTAVAFGALASPAAVFDARDAIRAAALYVANWFFIARSDAYFGPAVASSPVIHFWSLAVEEQFYLAWPLLLGGLVAVARRAGNRRWAVVRTVVVLGAAASAVAAVVISRSDLDRAYYGTDTRAYQLLAGALLALSPGVVTRVRRLPGADRLLPVAAIVGVFAIPVLALGRVDLGPVARGMATTVVVVGLLVALEAASSGPAARGLALAPLVYLGRISYGTYLWHWPVIVLIGEVIELSTPALLVVTVLVATGLASLSYQLLEMPIRQWRALDRRWLPVVATGLAASVFVGVVAVPRVLDADAAGTGVAAAGEGSVDGAVASGDAASVDWESAERDVRGFPECTAAAPSDCTVVEGEGERVLLVGDSHALALLPMLEGVARERGLQLSATVLAVCPWQRHLQFINEERARNCRAAKAGWYDSVLPALDPDVVVVANRPIADPANTAEIQDDDLGHVIRGTEAWAAAVEARTRETVDALRAEGRRVVIMEPIPVSTAEDDPLLCLADAESLAECRFVNEQGPTAVERISRPIAEEDPEVWSVDMDRLVCPYLPICDPVVGGTVVRRDDIHMTVTYSQSLAAPFGDLLDDNRILR